MACSCFSFDFSASGSAIQSKKGSERREDASTLNNPPHLAWTSPRPRRTSTGTTLVSSLAFAFFAVMLVANIVNCKHSAARRNSKPGVGAVIHFRKDSKRFAFFFWGVVLLRAKIALAGNPSKTNNNNVKTHCVKSQNRVTLGFSSTLKNSL